MTLLLYPRPTYTIALEEIERRDLERSGRRVKDVRVSVSRGQVLLEGRTDTYYGKQLAQHGALELVPEGMLENAIDVF